MKEFITPKTILTAALLYIFLFTNWSERLGFKEN